MAFVNIGLFLVSCLLLVVSGSWCVKYLSRLTHAFRLNEFAIGFIIMAISTSVPELFVGITAAYDNTPFLSVGNLIGANVLGLTLISGILILLKGGIKLKSKTIRNDTLYMFFITLVPLILILIDRKLSRIDGVILIIVFIMYMVRVYRQQSEFKEKAKISEGFHHKILVDAALFIGSMILLFISAELAVKYATALSIELSLPTIFIGLFFISIGTTLPELIFESNAVLKGHPEMALGTIMGSVVVNITLILGIVAIINPITGNFFVLLSSASFMILVSFIFATFSGTGSMLTTREGIALIMLYAFFFIIEFYIKILSTQTGV